MFLLYDWLYGGLYGRFAPFGRRGNERQAKRMG